MELEKLETNEKELNEEERIDMFNSIVMGKDVTETIKTSRGDFKIKYPRAKDIMKIGRLQALRTGGVSAESFDKNMLYFLQEVSTLDVVVISGPSWYENARKENANFSWLEIPSQALISEVYAKAYEFRVKVQQQLDDDKEKGNKGMATISDTENNGSSGLFDGIRSE